VSEHKKGERNPIATALGWCMACPPEHTLRRHAEAVVIDAIALSHYEYDAAELLGVTPLYLSTLLAKYPSLRPQSSWAEKRQAHLRTVMSKLETTKRKATK
jgi:hypothetical protein